MKIEYKYDNMYAEEVRRIQELSEDIFFGLREYNATTKKLTMVVDSAKDEEIEMLILAEAGETYTEKNNV